MIVDGAEWSDVLFFSLGERILTDRSDAVRHNKPSKNAITYQNNVPGDS